MLLWYEKSGIFERGVPGMNGKYPIFAWEFIPWLKLTTMYMN